MVSPTGKVRFNTTDAFLNEARKNSKKLQISTVDDLEFKGKVLSFDQFSILLERDTLLFKSNIISIEVIP